MDETRADGRTAAIPCRCVVCAGGVILRVRPEDRAAYRVGRGSVQDIFPYLAPAEREMLISGVCGDCFAKIFPPEDD